MFYYPLSSLLIECLILSIVEREDSYGYEISQTVKLVANIKESTLYPILRKLEQNGYLHTYSHAGELCQVLLPQVLFHYRFREGAAHFLKKRMERILSHN